MSAGLLACAFGLLVLAVRAHWEPLLRVDQHVLCRLHNYARCTMSASSMRCAR